MFGGVSTNRPSGEVPVRLGSAGLQAAPVGTGAGWPPAPNCSGTRGLGGTGRGGAGGRMEVGSRPVPQRLLHANDMPTASYGWQPTLARSPPSAPRHDRPRSDALDDPWSDALRVASGRGKKHRPAQGNARSRASRFQLRRVLYRERRELAERRSRRTSGAHCRTLQCEVRAILDTPRRVRLSCRAYRTGPYLSQAFLGASPA